MSAGVCKCGNMSREGQRLCVSCHASWMRSWRKTHRLSGASRRKANARSYAHVYLRRGKLVKKPCVVCASPDSEMHHDDYGQPLKVTWLCRKCHASKHAA